MHRIILSMLVLVLSVTTMVAQSGKEAFKAAKKSFDTYKMSGDTEAIAEAATMIEAAMASSEVSQDPKALIEAGDIYKEIIIAYVNGRILNDAASARVIASPAVKSAKAYMAAYNAADKKSVRKAALKGLSELQGNLTNEGIYAIQDGKDNPELYSASFDAFSTNLEVADFLRANGGEVIVTDEALQQDKYYGALAATLSGRADEALPYYEQLYAEKYDDAGIYDGLFKIYTDKGEDGKAEKILMEGRKLYPEESSLLFAEINYLLKNNRLDELTGKLEEAISKEPENMSLYATLAQVYEQLYKTSTEEGDLDKARMYYDKAAAEYERGLAKDPNSGKMIYGLGAMIYNRAAAKSQELVELGNDFSKEGQKKYEALKTEVDAEFAKALPFFKKAEMADPNDINTLIALKEMYARQDEYEISGEFKSRIETVQGGGKVSGSYFKEHGM